MGYSVTYPFGVAAPILFLYFAFRIQKPVFDAPAGTSQELLEIAVHNPDVVGKRLAEVATTLPAGVQIAAVRKDDRNKPALPELVLDAGDVVLAVASSKEALEQTREQLGEAAAGRITTDRRHLDYLRVFVSRPALVGRAFGDLAPPEGLQFLIVHVRRGDADLLPRPDLILEFGDRVGLLTDRQSFPAVRKFFGDSIKGTAEFSYVSIGIGLALGFLVGAIHLPVPGVGTVAIGLAGILVVALVLGKLRHTRGMNWTIPLSANLVLRNLGLTLFLAQVGMSSGPKFAATVAETGVLFVGYGAVIVLALVLPILILGLYVFRMPYDQLAGVIAGACGNPGILAYANKLAPTERTDIAFAMIFSSMTIVKILFVDIVPYFFGG